MKSFFKPTKVTWVVMLLLCCVVLIGLLFSSGMIPDIGRLTDAFAVIAIFVLIVPAVLFDSLGLTTLHPSNEAFLSFPNPTMFGYILSVITSLAVFYLIGSIVSKIWYKIKSKQL